MNGTIGIGIESWSKIRNESEGGFRRMFDGMFCSLSVRTGGAAGKSYFRNDRKLVYDEPALCMPHLKRNRSRIDENKSYRRRHRRIRVTRRRRGPDESPRRDSIAPRPARIAPIGAVMSVQIVAEIERKKLPSPKRQILSATLNAPRKNINKT
ncbi:hypothetical protein EVAR_23659_1 [Eumeta japonica]|uniref:Uncharacterized protein n=1 Tax=Eumeta variegata TaxID=151549 RepID=A0A4C1VIG9_EUMVA|nr:hypothetical protein EVAR_23659_1 [Eumeta japonica]